MPLSFAGRLARLAAPLRRRYLTGLAYRHTFGTAQGKEVLRDIMRFCMVGQELQAVDGEGRTDADGTLVNVGKHRVAQRIIAFLNFDEAAVERLLAQQEREAGINPHEET